MEKNSLFRVDSQSVSLERLSRQLEVPKSFIKMVTRFGLRTSLSIVIGRIRYRVRCRILYSIDLLKTCQLHYDQLKASKVLRYLILKSITSYRLRNLIAKIENHCRPVSLEKGIRKQSSKSFLRCSEEYNRLMSRPNFFVHF